jgi:hypothetical protein
MSPISTDQAAELFIEAVKNASPDYLVAFHNELFTRQKTTQEAAEKNPQAFLKRVLDHIQQGLEIDEVLDFWNVVFPRRQRLSWDEEDGLFHFVERQPVTFPE